MAAAEFFDEFNALIVFWPTAHEAQAAFDVCFGWIALTAFRGDLESKGGQRIDRCVA